MRTQGQIDAILDSIRARLSAKQRATGIELNISRDGYLQDDPWLSVIVSPGARPVRAYEHVNTLSDVEKELRADGIDHVLLVPAVAD